MEWRSIIQLVISVIDSRVSNGEWSMSRMISRICASLSIPRSAIISRLYFRASSRRSSMALGSSMIDKEGDKDLVETRFDRAVHQVFPDSGPLQLMEPEEKQL